MAANPMMGIEALGGIKGSIGIPETIFNPQVQQPQVDKAGFNDLLNIAVKQLNETQTVSESAMMQLAAGQNIELHNVVLAAQKASLTMQLALTVKNKITDAYQEIMRMSI
jgi:flagellar hook-basal body complex protein FliE